MSYSVPSCILSRPRTSYLWEFKVAGTRRRDDEMTSGIDLVRNAKIESSFGYNNKKIKYNEDWTDECVEKEAEGNRVFFLCL